jgi:hypothetical protein
VSTVPSIQSNVFALSRAELMKFLPTAQAVRAFEALTTDVPAVVDQSNVLATQIDSFSFNFDALNADVADLQSQIDAIDTTAGDAIAGTNPDGVFDNTTAINAAVSPTGTFFTAGKTHASFSKGGTYKTGLIDLHPSISIESYSRGGSLLVPANNLPALNANGAESAVVRFVRDTPGSSSNLAWAPTLSGFNIDFRGTTQTNPVDGIRTPNPNPANNVHDPDPDYAGNKDYVAGRLVNMDVVGASGSGWVVEGGNGRADVLSARMLNCALNGYDFGGNDIVMGGHWAVGGNGLFGLKVGLAAGFFAVTGNLWGSSATRSLTCGAAWFNQRKMFALGYSEFNDWLRMDGGSAYRGGVISNNVFAQFGSNFLAEGQAIDITGSPDSRLQGNTGTIEYQSLNFDGNVHVRTDKCGNFGTISAVDTVGDTLTSNAHGLANNTLVGVYATTTMPAPLIAGSMYYVVNATTNNFKVSLTLGGAAIDLTTTGSGTLTYYTFPTPSNAAIGGSITGNFGTAPAYLHDIGGSGSQPAMINIREAYCSAPNVKGWSGVSQAFTVTIASPGVFTTSTAHNLQTNYRVALGTTGDLPTGLLAGVGYYVTVLTTTTFTLSSVLGGAAINTSGTQRGTHTYWNITDLAPYNVHNGAQVNYAYQDAYTSLFRVGALGPVHSHIALGIAEIDAPNYAYALELGDRTQPSGVSFRNAVYGMTEFGNAVQYIDTAYDGRPLTNGLTRTLKAGQVLQRLSVAGGGIAGATIQLPTDLFASQFVDLFITGGPVTALTWGVTGAGAINANSPALPTYSQGFLRVRLWYERDTNNWYVLGFVAGDRSGTLGRVDGNGAQAGIVGEIQQSSIVQGSAVALTTTATTYDITSLALTAGNWKVSWAVKHRGSGASVTNVSAGVNTVSATLAPTKGEQCAEEVVAFTTQTGNLKTLSGGNYLLKLTGAATLYLSAAATFSAGTMSAFGVLTAERAS